MKCIFDTLRKGAFVLLLAACSSHSNIDDHTTSLKQIVVLYTNDEHGWMSESNYSEGAAKLAGLWREREGYSREKPFLILSGGDNWTGPAISTWFQGESMVEVMNAMGYTASAIGNHEFDFTVDVLKKRLAQADFAYLSANIRSKKDGKVPGFIRPFIIEKIADIQIAIIGLTTTSTPWSTFPDHVRDYKFIDYAQALREVVPMARDSGAVIQIVIGHVCRDALYQLIPVAEELGISIMAGGHCNQRYSVRSDHVLIMEGGSYMQGYARAEIIYDTQAEKIVDIQHRTVENRNAKPDPSVAEIVAKWESRIDSSLSKVIGYTDSEIERYSIGLVNMVTDSWLYVFPYADISVTNRGAIRQSIPPGEITLKTIVGVLPFQNTIMQLELTGDQVLACIDNLEIGGMEKIEEPRLSDGTPIYADSVYQVLTTDYLYARDDQLFSTYDPDPYDTSIHYRQPVIDWIISKATSESDPLDCYLNHNPRQ